VSGTLNVTDQEGDALAYSIVTNGTKGMAVITNVSIGAYTYTANVGSSGTDTFTFKANDGFADSNTATVTVTIIPVGACGTDITATVAVSGQGPLKLNKKTGRYTSTVTLKNGDGAVSGPISLVLDNLSSNATLFNLTGTTACAAPSGSPYVERRNVAAYGESGGTHTGDGGPVPSTGGSAMRKILAVCIVILLATVVVSISAAQQATMTNTEVLKADLSAPGREVVQTLIVIPSGAGSGGKHTHPGEEIAFVIEGAIRVEIEGEPPVVKNAGESIIVPAGRMHFAANAGSGRARLVSTYIVEKGRPRTSFVK